MFSPLRPKIFDLYIHVIGVIYKVWLFNFNKAKLLIKVKFIIDVEQKFLLKWH